MVSSLDRRSLLAALGGLIDWLDARGIQVVVVRMPTVDERQGAVAGSAVYPRIEATLSSFFAAHRLRALDLRPSFTTDDLFFDTHHVNPQGRRKLNEILLRFLQAPSG